MKPIVVLGGYGTFGSLVVRELARDGVPTVVAGRDLDRARALALELGSPHEAALVDAKDKGSCVRALADASVAVSCAGPFSSLGPALLDACLETGCHYADMADDRRYVALVRERGPRFLEQGLAAVFGCSSLPGLSCALAEVACRGAVSPSRRARITLFIGNRNPKGAAALRSAVGSIGARIPAPQGTLTGFGDREVVPLPAPFGTRAVYSFESPDYDLLPALVGTREVVVTVGFELSSATFAFALLARLSSGYGERTARWLERLAWLAPRSGCSGGAVLAEVFFEDGTVRRASISGPSDGQRMAALPCALVVRALASGAPGRQGALLPSEFLGAERLLEAVRDRGFELARA